MKTTTLKSESRERVDHAERGRRSGGRRRPRAQLVLAPLAIALLLATPGVASALITGAVGNDPMSDPGFPLGCIEVANLKSRIAWWEGPPFGGGQYTYEYRGNIQALSEALGAFSKVVAPRREIILRDGVGRSFWLSTSRESKPDGDVEMNWSFTVWVAESFHRLHSRPMQTFLSRSRDFRQPLPAPQMVIYVGGDIDWTLVELPEGFTVIDERLESHGFSLDAGLVITGAVWDVHTARPVPTAKVVLESYTPRAEGGYDTAEAASAFVDDKGQFTLTAPLGAQYEIKCRAEGYAPRMIDYVSPELPTWRQYDINLAHEVVINGLLVDSQDQPVAGGSVRLDDPISIDGFGYNLASGSETTTDAQGRFTLRVLEGFGRFWPHADGFVHVGIPDLEALVPNAPVKLVMHRAGAVEFTIDFAGRSSQEDYMVRMTHAEGEAVGRWGGSGNVDPEGKLAWKDIPPGQYIAVARPNPGSDMQESEPVLFEIKPGETSKIVLKAK